MEEKVRAAQSGDDEAFYELMLQHRERLYRVAYPYLQNEGECLEAIQEVTYRAYRELPKLKEPQFFSTWLIRILINDCHDRIKRNQRFISQETLPELATEHDGLDIDRLDISEALSRIEPKYRTILQLKYFEDMTVVEIAHTLNKPEGTIKTWLHQGLKGLRKSLEKGGLHNV